MEALIESGRGHYDAGRYQAALRQFTRATRLCRCTRGLKRERCACKDYEAVAERDDSIFDEAMFTCRCPVGRTFSKCDNRLHIKALDYRAATFEAMGELQRAERDAKWMLELAPRLPDGYLRLGKNARLQKNSWFAWKVYSAGVDANKHASLASPKFLMLHQALQPLRIRFVRKDPMHLPLELVHQIFSDFDVAELTKCLRVSKAWKGKLEGHHSRRLWCFLVFPENLRRAPRSGALKALVKRSGGSACKIVIMDTIGFDLSMDRLAILLRHSPNLQHLELGLADRLHYHFPEFPGRYCNLRHLAMGSEMPTSPPLRSSAAGLTSSAFIQCVAGNLEHLDLCGAPSRWAEQWDLPEFPRLKALRLTWPWRDESPRALPIFSLASKTPRLEQLCLGDLHLESNQSQEWKDSWHTLWSNLKVFTFILPEFCRSPLASPHTISNVTLINSLHAGNTLEHLDLSIMMDDVDESTNQVFSNADDLDRYGLTEADGSPIRRCNEFKNLQSLRLEHFALCPERMKTIFAAALGNGKLHTVDVAMPLEASYDSKVFARTLAAYSWLRGLETIRCLGISRFQLVDVPHCRDARSDLISFLASFPNLETLSLSTSYCSDVAMGCLVEELIKTTRVRTIYHKALSGVPMDRLTRLGAQNGVDIIWGSLPRVWPMPLGR